MILYMRPVNEAKLYKYKNVMINWIKITIKHNTM